MLVFLAVFLIFLSNIIECQQFPYEYRDGYLQCYSCGDCPEPFFLIRTQITLTPPDVGSCIKTVSYIENTGHAMVSKGFTRQCTPQWTPNVRVYCCQHNLCNGSDILYSSMLFIIMTFLIGLCFSSLI